MGFAINLPLFATSVIFFFYLAVSPFVYFRHDDWLILGNAVLVLPQNIRFLWEPYLFMSPSTKEIWFFRPFFKGIVWLCYSLFQYKIFFWILIHLTFILGSVFFGEKTLRNLKGSAYFTNLFFLFFVCSIALHFANIVWVGEGMMNAPQVFLLSLTLFLFFSHSLFSQWLSVLPYLLALGFKESSAFLPLFLFPIAWSEGQLKKKRFLLALHFLLFFLFLIFRLGFLPFNPGYKPSFTLNHFFQPIILFCICIFTPLMIFFFRIHRYQKCSKRNLATLLTFVPFLASILAPHLGHPFFSPGWILLPGFFSLWILCYCFPSPQLNKRSLLLHTLLLLFISTSLVMFQAWKLEWFSWAVPQKKMHEIIRTANADSISQIEIKNCINPLKPEITFQRVIGAKENLEFMWALHHSSPVQIRFVPCDNVESQSEGKLTLFWQFPNLN